MNKIPIVFSFDDNLLLPAGVCISSLLFHANKGTFYDIFILHDENAQFPKSNFLEKLNFKYSNFSITYRNVGNPFPHGFEIRGITIPAYYRLLIPRFIPEYSTIMYHDVDVIFRSDLSDLYLSQNLQDYYIAGVLSASSSDPKAREYRLGLGLDPVNYINSGNLIFNSEKLLQDGIVELFVSKIENKYKFQDQDIINIVCMDKIKFLPPSYSGTVDMYKYASNGEDHPVFKASELEEMLIDGNIHYNGAKPWKEYCINFDIWWQYYRNSVFYDPKYYFNFYANKLNELDNFSFMKRLKLLIRYFMS
ncbi:glycosyltransferase family 8 protein [Sphingobacterium composti Ten et al. 2007 non Yoo et al. 2007]|uniref:glycosyltransferase family 8 protein n=1 Tax=Sphingobacterium composti TaxID=363260 RepID=UPI001356CDE1|nr:glycosyltransferase family 8 protein [Sphingobacterium composti Ten et al. 2007 non Yoo et al. 2007]